MGVRKGSPEREQKEFFCEKKDCKLRDDRMEIPKFSQLLLHDGIFFSTFFWWWWRVRVQVLHRSPQSLSRFFYYTNTAI